MIVKKNILFVAFIMVSILNAQNTEVQYGFVHSLNMGRAMGYDYNALLAFNKKESYYVTNQDSLENSNLNSNNSERVGDVIRMGKKLSELGDQVYIDTKKDSVWSTFLMGKMMYLQEKTPQIDWKITTETKKIGKFDCTKATATFRGRAYTAWFTLAIPVKFGPWKLHGLPGLILEAYDKDKYVYWYFKNIQTKKGSKKKINQFKHEPDVTFITSYKDFKKAQQNKLDDMYERGLVKIKDRPGITIIKTKLPAVFIECEEE
jgi:GLPGLI family protein